MCVCVASDFAVKLCRGVYTILQVWLYLLDGFSKVLAPCIIDAVRFEQ